MICDSRLGQLALGLLVLLAGSASVPAADILYVSYYNSNKIEMFDTSGNDLGTFASSHLTGPCGLAFDPSGNLLVANFTTDSVSKFSATGSFLYSFGSTSNIDGANSLAIDSSGNVYVTNANSNTLSKFSNTGSFVSSINAQVNSPQDLAFDKSGKMYVLGVKGAIERFDSSGAYDSSFSASTGLSGNYGLAIDSTGNIYASYYYGSITKFNSSGAKLSTITNASLNGANGLAFDSQGNLYAANFAGNSISKFDASGSFLGSWSTGSNSGPAYFAIRSVPEPSTYALGVIATGVMAAVARRRKALKG